MPAQHHDLVPGRAQRAAEDSPDLPGPPGDDHLHAATLDHFERVQIQALAYVATVRGTTPASAAAQSRPTEGRAVKFILVVVLVIAVAFLLFKVVLPGMRRR